MSTSYQKQQSQNQRIITLQASDGPRFDVTEPIAMRMGIVRLFLDENNTSEYNSGHQPDAAAAAAAAAAASSITVPLLNVSSSCLVKAIEYCSAHLQFKVKSTPKVQVEAFDSGFVNDLGDDMMKELLLCANYLEMKDLLVLLEKSIAKLIENKSPEFVRKFFGIDNDFSPEEEAALRRDNRFAFDGIDED